MSLFFSFVRRSQAVSWFVVDWSGLVESDYFLDYDSAAVIDLPYGPVGLRGLSLRKRLGIWAYQVAHLQEQCSSWHWFKVLVRASFSSLPRAIRGC